MVGGGMVYTGPGMDHIEMVMRYFLKYNLSETVPLYLFLCPALPCMTSCT